MREWQEIFKADQRYTSMEWDWATKKWPTSHDKKLKDDLSKKWKWKFLGNSSSSAISSANSTQRKLMENSSTSVIKNFVMGWWVDEQSRLGKTGLDQDWSRKCVAPIMTQREVESDQDGLVSYGTCHALPLAVRLSFWIPMAPFVALHRIRGFQWLEFREFVQATACVYFLRVSPCDSMHCTLSSTVCNCKPCQHRMPHQLWQTLFRGVMTPSLTLVRPGH